MANWSYINGLGQPGNGSTQTSLSATLTWSATAGDLLVVSLLQHSGSTSGVGISDSGSNTWTYQNSQSHTNQCTTWTTTVTSGGELTITATAGTAAYLSLIIDEFRSAAGVGSVVSVVGAGGDSGTASPGTIVPTGTVLMYAVVGSYATESAVTPSSPFSNSAQILTNNSNPTGSGIYAVDQTTSQTPTMAIAIANWASVGFGVTASSGSAFQLYYLGDQTQEMYG